LGVLDEGRVARFAAGYEASLSPLRGAIAAIVDERDPGESLLEWLWFAPIVGREVWDDDGWHRLTLHLVALCRDTGALNALQRAIDDRASLEIRAGRYGAA